MDNPLVGQAGIDSQAAPPSRSIFQGRTVEVGLFRCRPDYPGFANTGPTRRHLLVFPRTSVRITHAGREPVVASPNVVMLYNRGQDYRRDPISTRGDHCEWFSFNFGVLVEALRPYDLQIESHPERPFRLTHAYSDAASYLLQRRVVEHILANERPDPLFVEETLLRVLRRTLRAAFGQPVQRSERKTFHYSLVQEIKALLAARLSAPHTLESIAAELHYSPFHLCRVFQQETGSSIHQYLNRLRLRTALEWISAGAGLGDLAFDLGYSSHSHFTQAFRKEFGSPPAALRAAPLP